VARVPILLGQSLRSFPRQTFATFCQLQQECYDMGAKLIGKYKIKKIVENELTRQEYIGKI
jgi:hypothetical protein